MPGEFKRLLKLGSFETLHAGDELPIKDTRAEAISVVIKGTLDVKVGHNALSKICMGGFAGEMSYFTGRAPSVNVTAAVTTRIFRIGLAKFEHLRGEHPEMHMKLIGILARDVAEKLRQTTSVVGGQAQEHVS